MKLYELVNVLNCFSEAEVFDHTEKKSLKVDLKRDDQCKLNPLLTSEWLSKEVFSILPTDKLKVQITVF